MKFVKNYRISHSRLIFTVCMTIILCYLPISSIYEIASTGSVDFEAVGEGRRKIPRWQAYAIGWLCALFLVPNFFGPIIWLYISRFEFSISETAVSTPRKSIRLIDLQEISRIGWRNDIKISSKSGDYIILPSIFGNRNINEIQDHIIQIIRSREY